ncbi:MAG: hypothetical protein JW726_00155, partial [Anaerolineales bacterium]|nr:hypothetical protein [Anaerolineales bacterium]
MLKKFERWIRSKTGMWTMIGAVALIVIVAFVGQAAGWWNILGGPGAAGVPAPSYDPPPGGFTCLPSCAIDDGKFLVVVGGDQASFAGAKVVVWVSVPGNWTTFDLSMFDGDAGKDATGVPNYGNRQGHWDNSDTETTYTLYADPIKSGLQGAPVGTWHGNQD